MNLSPTTNNTARGAAALALGLALALALPIAGAAEGDPLVVGAKVLTMREAANRKSNPRAWLKRGHKLTEVARDGLWIQVKTGLPEPKATGWVHGRHVAPADPDDGATPEPAVAAQTLPAPQAAPDPAPEPAPEPDRQPEPQAEQPEVTAAPEAAAPESASSEAASSEAASSETATPEPAATEVPATDSTPATVAAVTPAPEPAPKGAQTQAKHGRAAFEAFYEEYRKLTARYRALSQGKDLFLSAVDKGDGKLELTATDYWFTGTDKDRENDVATVMRLWRDVQENKAMIVVVDENGQEQMRMFEQL